MGDDVLALTTPQLDIWHAQQLSPDIPFVIAYYVELTGSVDVDALLSSGLRAHTEYSSAPMRIVDAAGRPSQTFAGSVRDAAQTVDLRGVEHPREAALQWMERDCRSPFPLDGCLVRLRLFRLSDDHVLWYTCAHHISLDGYASVRVLERGAAIYTAVMAGEEPAPHDATSPAAFVEEDRQYQGSARARRGRDFWRASALEHSRTGVLSLAGSAAPQPMSMTAGGVAASSQHAVLTPLAGRTTSSVVIAAFAVFVARMTDSTDVRLSLPVSARSTALLRRGGSTTSNVVPLDLPGIGRTTVGGAIKLTETALGTVLRHQRSRPGTSSTSPGESPLSAASFGPTVNVMMFANSVRLGGVDGQIHILTTGPVADLAVDIYPGRTGQGPRIDFEANPAVYPAGDLALHHKRFLHLLDGFADPNVTDTAVCDLELFLPDEPPTASTGAAATSSMTLIDAFDAAVRNAGERTAVDDGDTVLTYLELNERVDDLAGRLTERGAGPEAAIAVCISRSIASVIAFWAVARVGAVYVPIDPKLPDSRADYILRDSRAVLGLRSSAEPAWTGGGIDWLDIGVAGSDETRRRPATRKASLSNAAYVIYTSGSTGEPKGVVVTHEGIGALVQQLEVSYGLDASSRVCHLTSPGFDTAIVEHLASAAAGATLVIAPPQAYAGPELTQLLARRHLTHLLITPSALVTLGYSDLTDIETIIIGGESAPRDVVAAWSPGRRLLNAYGPTETTCSVTMTDALVAGEAIGIGTAMVGTEIHLLDRTLRPVPTGAVGEVYIATTGIARGYGNRAAATASRFVADPLGGAGRRLFRSGDMARARSDGSLAFVGRTDDQVKIRGNRIELGEIDAALRTHPRVTAAASTTRRTHSGDLRIDGYIVCDGAQPLDPQEVRGFLANILPGSAVPATITVLESIPLTVNRKLDRTALPEPKRDVAIGVDTEPGSCTEDAVARAFKDVLGLTVIDMHASFFALGGDSLTATGVIARLNTELGVDIGIRDLVDAGSVRALSTFIEAHPADRPRPGRPVPGAAESIAVIPLAPQQMHIDRAAQLPLYNLPFAAEITGPFDTSAAEAAFVDVLVRHRSLRTIYPDSPWGPRQVVVDDPARLQSVLGITAFDPRAVDEVLAAAFDVRGELPIRATLFEKAPGIHLVVCSVHHIAADGWSLRLLAQDFTVAYRARASGRAPGWPKMPLQYTDFSIWAAQRPGSPDLDFWSREFEGLAFDTAVETDRPRSSSWDVTGDRIDLQLAVDITDGLDRVARANETGRFTVLRAGLLVLLARATGTSDLVIGTPIAGRRDPELETIVGTFVNTVAIRSDIAAAATFEDVIAIAHASKVRALDHSDVPFETVAAHIDPGPHLGRHPLFQVALSLDVFTDSHFDIGATHVDITPRPLDIAKCDLHFHLVERRDAVGRTIGMDVGIVYPTALFDRGTVQSLGELYEQILRRMITGPGEPWSTAASILQLV